MSGEKKKVGRPKKSPQVVLDQKDGDVKTFYSQQDLKDWMDAQDALVHTITGKHPEDQTNPDCEPATKGFVKCIARTLFANTSHKHYGNFDSLRESFVMVGLAGVFGFGLFTLFIGGALHDPSTLAMMKHVEFARWVVSVSSTGLISSLILLAASLLCISEWVTDSASVGDANYIGVIQKYKPPTCEKKKDCE